MIYICTRISWLDIIFFWNWIVNRLSNHQEALALKLTTNPSLLSVLERTDDLSSEESGLLNWLRRILLHLHSPSIFQVEKRAVPFDCRSTCRRSLDRALKKNAEEPQSLKVFFLLQYSSICINTVGDLKHLRYLLII